MIYGQLIFPKVVKTIQWGKEYSSTTGAGTSRYPQVEERNLDCYLTASTKINSKWITGLNLRAKTMQFLEEDNGINLCDLGLWNDFLYMTQKAQVRKEKTR